MTDLATWLLDRIAEDEAVAREVGAYLLRSSQPESIAHADRWHPARVLAECAAKRRIVAECATQIEDEVTSGAITGIRVLRLLALPYADHDGYDPSWGVQ
jgi:hypothetical protein